MASQSQHDLVIRGGLVVDGSGADPVQADIAIDGQHVTTIGKAGRGRDEIDARGLLVTPGFVDLHTHLDAQIGWDPMLTPISWHGVTTALLGNCGVTFAPCRPADREFLAGMMETVEDIPREAILSGLPWTWENYGGYLDALDKLQPAINVAGLVGHCAVRSYVMGERGVEEAATADDKQQMAQVVADSIAAGAVGFSTSRFLGHYLPDGRHVPGTHADHDELVHIARVVGQRGALMQNVFNLGGDFDGEIDLLRAEAEAASTRVLFSITAGRSPRFSRQVTGAVEALRAAGHDISAVCIPRGSGLLTGLQGILPWSGPAWQALTALDFDARVAALADEALVARLVADAEAVPSRLGTEQMFWLGDGDVASYVSPNEQSVHALAAAAGEHPAATWLRLSRASGGHALFTVRALNPNLAWVQELITTDFCLPGLGDAGAHVGQIMDSGWATFVLSHWMRDTGLYSLPEAVRRITSAPARVLGLRDRGVLRAGARADVNVIDIDQLGERMPRMVNDFPGGAKRFVQQGRGYRATVCNGSVILRDDTHTGTRSGEVLRHAV